MVTTSAFDTTKICLKRVIYYPSFSSLHECALNLHRIRQNICSLSMSWPSFEHSGQTTIALTTQQYFDFQHTRGSSDTGIPFLITSWDDYFEVSDEIYDDSQSVNESENEDTDETDTEEDDLVQFPNKVVPDPVFLVQIKNFLLYLCIIH